MNILEPGIHRECDVAAYHLDPCPAPSLTQSIAKILLQRSPLHAWAAHPKLNPDHQPDNDTKYDLGNVAHALLLGRGKAITVVDAPDWRTKAAKEQRGAIEASGGVAVLPKTWNHAHAMVAVARAQLADVGLEWDNAADSEVALVWCEDIRDGNRKSRVWFRTLIDRLTSTEVCDYKTTDGIASPRLLESKMVQDGWDIQAAMHARGLAHLDPQTVRGQPTYIVQETSKPYAVCVARLATSAVQMGAVKLERAAEMWAHCLRRSLWPGYGEGAPVLLGYPDWALREFEGQAVSALEAALGTMTEASQR